jgi:hypothetical protein
MYRIIVLQHWERPRWSVKLKPSTVLGIQLFGVVMTESLEWDWPSTKRYRKRRPVRVEVLPPKQDEQEPRPQRVEIILRSQQQSTTNWPMLIVAVGVVLFVWRYGFALLLIGVIAWKLVAAMLMIAAVVAAAAWRERRYGRPF